MGGHGGAAFGRLPDLLTGGRIEHPFALCPFLALPEQAICLFPGLGLGLDVDAPTGQAGGQTGVLAFLADGQGQLMVGHDDLGGTGVGMNANLFDLGWGQGLGDEVSGIVAEGNDVDLLAP